MAKKLREQPGGIVKNWTEEVSAPDFETLWKALPGIILRDEGRHILVMEKGMGIYYVRDYTNYLDIIVGWNEKSITDTATQAVLWAIKEEI